MPKKDNKKILFFVIDGLADDKILELNNRTPLQAADTPAFDNLAQNGLCGLVKPYLLPTEKLPNSDVCHLALFGYDPKKYYLGRGVYEAVGAGIKLKKGDIALRMNFATVNENMEIIDRRAQRIDKTEGLFKSLEKIKIKGAKIILKKTYGHRGVLVLRSSRGVKLSHHITGNDNKKLNVKVQEIKPTDNKKESLTTANILNEFLEKAHEVLKNHVVNRKREKEGMFPANYILVRGAGIIKKQKSFYEKYKLKACCVAGGNLYRGIAKFLGMDLISVKGANGLPNTNLRGKFKAVKNSLEKYDFVFLHIKAPDSFAEDGDFISKRKFIEKIDKEFSYILPLPNTKIIVTGDHATCSKIKSHCLNYVPLLFYNGVDKDDVRKFYEEACSQGKLGLMNQLDVIKLVLK
ncbi:hypothetical protein HRbin34_00210 [bacterium HR34]|nr:hypothetical protein HRbin34_00210 [bacterium HR34]